jgi:hypothetical protein
MIRLPMLALAGAATFVLLLVLGEWVGGELRLARIAAPPPLAQPPQERALAAGQTAAPPEAIDSWVQTALARPLMSASRRPAAVVGGSDLALGNGLPRLAGTLFTSDGATAIFARDEAGHAVIVHQGGTLGPYRVTGIEPDKVTLEGPNGVETLHPRFGDAREGGGYQPGPYLPGPMNMPGVMQPPQFQPPQFQPPVQPDNQDNQ